jgi:hypothetical protein
MNSTLLLANLQRKHAVLSEQVQALSRRGYLTPSEQREFTELKKRKLWTKDQLFAVRRHTG